MLGGKPNSAQHDTTTKARWSAGTETQWQWVHADLRALREEARFAHCERKINKAREKC